MVDMNGVYINPSGSKCFIFEWCLW